jgi:hypothetical protein
MKHELRTEILHKKTLTKVFDKETLKQLLIDLVLNEAGERFDRKTDVAAVTFKEATEGSPGYVVGYSAVVSITIDQEPKATEASPA